MKEVGFEVWDLGFEVWGFGLFEVWEVEGKEKDLGVQGSGFGIQGAGCKVQGAGCGV